MRLRVQHHPSLTSRGTRVHSRPLGGAEPVQLHCFIVRRASAFGDLPAGGGNTLLRAVHDDHGRRVVPRPELERAGLLGQGNTGGALVVWRELYEREQREQQTERAVSSSTS